MLLEQKSKFDLRSPTRERLLSPDLFGNWQNNHMYRTSYNDMGVIKSPLANKNFHIPQYQGYIPGKIANNEIGGTFSTISRRVFSPEKLDAPSLYATTRFNWKTFSKQDDTIPAWTHKHGKQTILRPHPKLNDNKSSTIFRDSYMKPEQRLKPVSRQAASCKDLLFDNTMKTSHRPVTQVASGFMRNRQLCDGQGWVTEKALHTDMVRTEYRNRFNKDKPFHKTSLMASTGKLPKINIVYDVE